ncbi:MAG: hypothetical protein RLZ77_208 [Bacteroidota bacterium]
MKIINYIFLLVLLAFVAATVHIGTQKNEFNVTQSQFIKAPKSQVYLFLNDCRNWQTYSYWKQNDPSQLFSFPSNTIGTGGYCAWDGSNESGKMIITNCIENKKISQKIQLNGRAIMGTWTLKDSLNGTVVNWHYAGSVNFKSKVKYALEGGVTAGIRAAMRATLRNLNKTISYELNSYKIDLKGVTKKKGCYYLGEVIHCKTTVVQKNIRILVPRMLRFFQKNKLTATGAPFVIYHAFDYPKGYSKIAVCLPIKDSVSTSPGSQIIAGTLETFSCYKTTLKGDYQHIPAARKKTRAYFTKNHIQENTAVPLLEVYTNSSTQVANPSQWITELYFPIKPIASVPSPAKEADSLTTLP